MKTYLINLDRSSERLSRMTGRFERINVPFTRIAAIDGLSLSDEAVNAFLYARRQRRWNYGEIGCFMSHLKAWQTLLDSGDDYAAIFEDDAFVSSELTALLSSADWVPEDADIVRLETTFWSTEISKDCSRVSDRINLHRLFSLHHGAGAYIISRSAAIFLMENRHLLRTTLDSSLFDFQEPSCRTLVIYQLNPAPVLQETVYKGLIHDDHSAYSEITRTEWIDTPKWPLKARKLVREVKRPVIRSATRIRRFSRVRRGQSLVARVAFFGAANGLREQEYLPGIKS